MIAITKSGANAMFYGERINVRADERILDNAGRIDPEKLQPIIFDVVQRVYRVLGAKVGNTPH